MKKLLSILILMLIASCIKPLPPCVGSEEQVYRCKSLRSQERQERTLREVQIQQNQLIWNDFNRKHVKRY